MTLQEFQNTYHSYAVDSLELAETQAELVNEVAEGFVVLPVYLMGKYVLMTRTAYDLMRSLSILE